MLLDYYQFKDNLQLYREQGDMKQTRYCLSKAITADPEDVSLWYHRASIYSELGDHQKAAESYEQIARLCPNDVEVLKAAVQVSSLSFLQYLLNFVVLLICINLLKSSSWVKKGVGGLLGSFPLLN